MIAVLITWEVQPPFSREALVEKFQARAALYDGITGFHSKTFWIDEQRGEYGGFYLWESRSAAEGLYTPEWIEQATIHYGSRPEIRYLEVPIYLD
jgi:heme-degrading monooxygenase HmoA